MNYSAFITDFLRAAHLPRISAQEPLPDQDLIQQITAAKEKEIAPAAGPTASCIRSLLFLAAGDLSQAIGLFRRCPPRMPRIFTESFIASTMTSIMPGTGSRRPVASGGRRDVSARGRQ
jgi:hypothetical protein